jgi:hypothetical protein
MTARITELIDKRDNVEIIRDEIAAILKLELTNQEALAADAGKDPHGWRVRVFSEASNPWGEYQHAPPNDSPDAAPLVNVWLNNVNYDGASSNIVERQKATATYNLDCYGYGQSEDNFEGGHVAGDARAATESHRALRLVRNVLMAATYTYLGQAKEGRFVWKRFPQSVQMFQPMIDGRPATHVVGARLALDVELNEFSPQVQGVPIELVSTEVKRAGTGEVLLTADFDVSD